MAFLKALGNFLRAKDRQAAEGLEEKNAVAFSENDLEDMRQELQKAISNKGHIKGTIITYQEEVKDKKGQIKDLKAKVEQLLKAEKRDVALKVAAKIQNLQNEIEVAEAALKAQEELYKQQEANVEQLKARISDCESELKMMKTMQDVTKSNEALAAVNLSGAKSASQRFEDRRKKMSQKMNASKALAEEASLNSPDALDREVDTALGKTAGQDILAEIEAKMK